MSKSKCCNAHLVTSDEKSDFYFKCPDCGNDVFASGEVGTKEGVLNEAKE